MTATARITVRAGGSPRARPIGWWGVVVLIATEAAMFAGLLSSYFFVRADSESWPQGGIAEPELRLIIPFTAVLLASSIPVAWAEAKLERGQLGAVRAGLALQLLMGAAFLAHQLFEYQRLDFGPGDNAYASLFFLITGLHGLHVAVGLGVSAVVQAKAWTGRLDADRRLTLTVFALYWHFVDVVWIFVFTSLYLAVRW